ncbi:transcriptional regulator [Acidicapsa acidisoli]|uniref:transcriptional regulator n=1 Tax=Acidicapsa acidisoli TaxID=1615681 RepID=UPI0021DF645E|nr:transcriptional regulator [Acidicapsa acidisoli]
MSAVTSTLYAELWVSLASLLRSYTAAHGLNRKEQATVELGEESIIVRIGDRWLRLDRSGAEVKWARENSATGLMRFTIKGTLQTRVDHEPHEDIEEEMDMQAEAWARELMQ